MFSNNKKVKIGAVELMVELIDWTKINEKISQATGTNVEVRSTNGLIKTVYGNKEPDNIEYAIIDNECCGTVSEWRNMYIPTTDDNLKIFESVFTCRIFQGVEFYEILEDKTKRAMFPAYSIDISLETILECLTGEKQPLYVYMGGRYSYNDRLQENESKTLDKFVIDTDIQKHEYSDITVE
mgnify:CR=1 FL=1